jgi:hypothetical protein
MQPAVNAVHAQEGAYNRHVTFTLPNIADQPAVPLHIAPGRGVATVHANELDSANEHIQPQSNIHHLISGNVNLGSENTAEAGAPAGDATVVVPLSSVPLGALPDLPADGINRDNSKHRHGRKHSKSATSSSSISSATRTTGTSKFRQNIEDAAEELAVHVNHPRQVRRLCAVCVCNNFTAEPAHALLLFTTRLSCMFLPPCSQCF